MAKKKPEEDDKFSDDAEVNALVEMKVSSDGGETWFRRKINMAVDLDESGLRPGEIFQLQEDQYEVLQGDGGLKMKKLKKPMSRKQTVVRQR